MLRSMKYVASQSPGCAPMATPKQRARSPVAETPSHYYLPIGNFLSPPAQMESPLPVHRPKMDLSGERFAV